jgi:hypothetical protein
MVLAIQEQRYGNGDAVDDPGGDVVGKSHGGVD